VAAICRRTHSVQRLEPSRSYAMTTTASSSTWSAYQWGFGTDSSSADVWTGD